MFDNIFTCKNVMSKNVHTNRACVYINVLNYCGFVCLMFIQIEHVYILMCLITVGLCVYINVLNYCGFVCIY